jgi:hypothetical protein
VVFTNLVPEDIDERRTTARGVLALKSFLAYARDGRLPGQGNASLAGVAARLAGGLPETRPVAEGGIGFAAGNLAVRLDDAAWSAAATCRDRERLVDEVLAGLGWRIHHAWRLGWWRRGDDELRRLREAAAAKPVAAPRPAAGTPVRDETKPPAGAVARTLERWADQRRTASELPPEAWDEGLLAAIEDACGLDENDIGPATARAVGVRPGPTADAAAQAALSRHLAAGRVVRRSGGLSLA